MKSKIAAEIFKGVHRLMKPEWGRGSRNSHRNNRSVKIVRVMREERESKIRIKTLPTHARLCRETRQGSRE